MSVAGLLLNLKYPRVLMALPFAYVFLMQLELKACKFEEIYDQLEKPSGRSRGPGKNLTSNYTSDEYPIIEYSINFTVR